jgi:peptidoglycan/LPS O-acetylase OafA/YrhL
MSKPTTSQRLWLLDMARFAAAMMVVMVHFGAHNWRDDQYQTIRYPALEAWTEYGFMGVPLFFMISGFVICLSAQGRFWARFAAARCLRIYPALWIACSISYLLILAFGHDHRFYDVSFGQYITSMFLVHIPFGFRPIDGVYWSLVAEMTFYAWITLILALKQFHHLHRFLWGWAAISLPLLYVDAGAIERFFIPDFAGFFIAGVAFYFLYQARHHHAEKRMHHWGLLAVSMLLNCLYFVQHVNKVNPLFDGLHLTAETCILYLAAFYGLFFVLLYDKPRYSSPFWVTLGLLTYPLYLLHNTVGTFAINHLLTEGPFQYAQLGMVILGCILVSWWFTKYLEAPFTKWLRPIVYSVQERLFSDPKKRQ